MDQSLFAAPHGLSQRITSFIACACQGIHQMPLRHLIVLIANAHRLPGLAKLVLLACARRAAKPGRPDTPKCADKPVPRPLEERRTGGPGLPFKTPAANKCHRRVRCGTHRKHAERFRVRIIKTSFSSGVRLRAVRQRRSMTPTRPGRTRNNRNHLNGQAGHPASRHQLLFTIFLQNSLGQARSKLLFPLRISNRHRQGDWWS